jgi:hypothetical protein
VATAVTFPVATALAKGGKYVLHVKFRSAMFANSNIYWVTTSGDDGYLKFDPYIDPLSTAYNIPANREQQQKQGVLFRWGSLIGISAPGRGGMQSSWVWTDPIYVPSSPTAWTRTTAYAAGTDGKWSGTAFSDIPYVASVPAPYGRDVYCLSMLGSSDYAVYRGDICKYLNSGYRMPTLNEFGVAASAWTGTMVNWYNNGATTTADGQTLMAPPWGRYRKVNDMYFSGIGQRDENGTLWYAGTTVIHWSSSVLNATTPVAFNTSYSGTNEATWSAPASLAVRCVKN